MNLWCGPTGPGGWLVATAACLAVVALAVWGVSRLFPIQRSDDARTTLDPHLASDDITPMSHPAPRTQRDDDDRPTMTNGV